jgi:hypothetical protein
MNTLKSLVIKLGSFGLKSILPLLVCGLALPAFGQLKWSSYDTSGNLVTANVATGGDIASGGSVTFTIPANTQWSFVTKNITPFSLATAASGRVISFKMSASGGLSAVSQGVFVMGWGCYNSAGTASFADDVGYFGMLAALIRDGEFVLGHQAGAGHHHHWISGR